MASEMNELTAADKKFIDNNYPNEKISVIATNIGKPEKLVRDYIESKSFSTSAPSTNKKKKISLRDTAEWVFITEQFSKKEQVYFDAKYTEYTDQLDYDMEPTERKQLIQMIEFDIFIQRNKIARKQLIDRIDAVNRRLKKALEDADIDEEQKARDELISLNSGMSGSNNELINYQASHDKLMQFLDGTRMQRLKNSASTKVNWQEFILSWHDRKVRDREALINSMMRKASDKETKRLSEYHEFSDKIIDQPLLNSETVKDDHTVESMENGKRKKKI